MRRLVPLGVLLLIPLAFLARTSLLPQGANGTATAAKGMILEKNGASLDILSGAVASKVDISIREDRPGPQAESTAASSALVLVGSLWHLEPSGMVLQRPAELALPFGDLPASALGLDYLLAARWDGATWEPLDDGYIDVSSRHVHVHVSVLSDFAIVAGKKELKYPMVSSERKEQLPPSVRDLLSTWPRSSPEVSLLALDPSVAVPPLLVDRFRFPEDYPSTIEAQGALTVALVDHMLTHAYLLAHEPLQVRLSNEPGLVHTVSPADGDDLSHLITKIVGTGLPAQLRSLNERFGAELAEAVRGAQGPKLTVLVVSLRLACESISASFTSGWLFLVANQQQEWAIRRVTVSNMRVDSSLSPWDSYVGGIPSVRSSPKPVPTDPPSPSPLGATGGASANPSTSTAGASPSLSPIPSDVPPTPTASPRLFPTALPTATRAVAPSRTPTASPTLSPNPTSTSSPRVTQTATPKTTATPTERPTSTPSITPTRIRGRPSTRTAMPTRTPMSTPTPAKEPTHTPVSTPTRTVEPTNTRVTAPTSIPRQTNTPVIKPKPTPKPKK